MNRRDPILILCAVVVGVAAIVASFSTLAGLAAFVGWKGVTAWLLPCCLDALAVGSGRVWLSAQHGPEARSYARACAFAALAASMAGNATGHLLGLSGATLATSVLAILVGFVPPVALAAVGHLWTLASARGQTTPPSGTTRDRAETSTPAVPVSRTPAASTRDGSGTPAGTTRDRSGTSANVDSPAVSTNRDKARRLWDNAPADAKPSGGALARYAGVDASLGRRWRREFLAA